jgi:hypothetical protein
MNFLKFKSQPEHIFVMNYTFNNWSRIVFQDNIPIDAFGSKPLTLVEGQLVTKR